MTPGPRIAARRATAALPCVAALGMVQDAFELEGETVYRGTPEYHPFEDAAIMLQAHGDPSPPISVRNIWVRELE